MKKSLWIIVLLVIVSILLSLRVFTPLTKADDSLLSQVVKKTQLNPETSDDFMEVVLAQERHFVEVSFIVITVFMAVLFCSFAYVNYRVTRSQLEGIEEKMEKKFEKKFDSLKTDIMLSSVDGTHNQALALEESKPVDSLILYRIALNRLMKCPIENKEVQKRIIDELDRMYKILQDKKAISIKVPFIDETKKKTKDTLDELLSKYPLLKDKVKEIKDALEIDS